MESVNKKAILISLIMALFTTFLVFIYIKKATTKPEILEYTNVYVAAKTLPPKHKITKDDIKEVKVTREYLNPKAVLNNADIIGNYIKDSIIEGEQILRDRLADGNKNDSLVYNIPEGKRAVSINVNEQIEVANLIRPGDSVDVIASFNKEEIEDKTSKTVYSKVTRTILQNIKVLALGQDQSVNDDKSKELPKTVTLSVDPQEAEKLVYASEYAVLRLALRPVGDSKNPLPHGVVRGDMANGKDAIIMTK